MTSRIAVSMFLLAIGALSVCATLAFSLRGMVAFPEPDFVNVLLDLRNQGVIPALWVQIEGHRVVFPRLLLLADYFWFGGTNGLTISSVFLMNGLMFGAVAWAAVRRLADKGILAAAIFCLMAVLVFGPYYEIYAHQQYAFYSVILFFSMASIGCFWLGVRQEQSSRFWLILSAFFALLSGFSGLPGIFVWPIMAFVAIACRRWRTLLLIAATFVVFTAIFSVNAVPTNSFSSVLNLLGSPLDTLGWISRYLGSVFGQALFVAPLSHFSDVFSLATGLVGVALAIAVLCYVLCRPDIARSEEGLLTAILLLTILWVVGAVAKHSQFDTDVGILSRYFHIVGWYWGTIMALLIIRLQHLPAIRPAAVAIVLALSVGLMPVYAFIGLKVDARGSMFDAAKTAIQANVSDQELFGNFNLLAPDHAGWKPLRARMYPPFDVLMRSPASLLQRPIPLCPERILGWEAMAGGGWRLWGKLPKAVQAIYIFGRGGRLVGLGRPWHPPIATQFAPDVIKAPVDNGWWGYTYEKLDAGTRLVGVGSDSAALCELLNLRS